MSWLSGIGLAFGLLVVVAAGLSALGSMRWARRTRALARGLEPAHVRRATATTAGARPTHYALGELAHLPAPVQRYFRAALWEGQPIISSATIDLEGSINLSTSARQWKGFRSRQHVVTNPPGFLWDARVSLLPGMPVRVHDAYIAGEGLLHAAALGLYTLADLRGDGEVARAEFMRYFAESAWYPTSLLPGQGVHWQAVDARSANATLVDGPITVTLLFRFNDAGLIGSFRAEARAATVGKTTVMLPWEGTWSDYRVHDGMSVPFHGEVCWIKPGGQWPYFRGTVSSLEYQYAR